MTYIDLPKPAQIVFPKRDPEAVATIERYFLNQLLNEGQDAAVLKVGEISGNNYSPLWIVSKKCLIRIQLDMGTMGYPCRLVRDSVANDPFKTRNIYLYAVRDPNVQISNAFPL